MHYCIGGDRGWMSAVYADYRTGRRELLVLPMAVRALEALRPAFMKKKSKADIFITEPVRNLLFVHREGVCMIQRLIHCVTSSNLLTYPL